MRARFRLWLPGSLVALCGLLAAGCGGSGLNVEGKVLNNGQPYTFSADKEELQLVFVTREGDKVSSFQASVNPDGTFRVTNPQGQGIPKGPYQVVVMSLPYQKNFGEDEPVKFDKFRGKYSLAKTPLKVDLASDAKNVTIDVSKGTVSQ